MYNLIQSKKANLKNKKGFTLVEVIVVLVILAILAAILIPSMIKYIDKAEQKAIVAEGRSVLLAAQTLASEDYKGDTAPDVAKVKELAEVKGDVSGIVMGASDKSRQVIGITYKSGGYTATYAAGKFTTEKE